jgi:DNA-binding protein H-NS
VQRQHGAGIGRRHSLSSVQSSPSRTASLAERLFVERVRDLRCSSHHTLRRTTMPYNGQTSQPRSVEEIQAQLAQLEADGTALREALREQQAAEFAAFIGELRERIDARGYSLDDVVALLSKGRRGRSAKQATSGVTRYVDPDNPAQSYSRGPLPNWLREKMEAAGYDPADKAQREQFKATHLRLAA